MALLASLSPRKWEIRDRIGWIGSKNMVIGKLIAIGRAYRLEARTIYRKYCCSLAGRVE